jgi:hypothetical protein
VTGATMRFLHFTAVDRERAFLNSRESASVPPSRTNATKGPRNNETHRNKLATVLTSAPCTEPIPVAPEIEVGIITPAFSDASHGSATCSAMPGSAQDTTHVNTKLTTRARITAGWSLGDRSRRGHRYKDRT